MVATIAGLVSVEGLAFSDRSGLFAVQDFEAEYRLFLSETVFCGFQNTAEVSYAEIPSFAPERGFWMVKDGGDYFVAWSEAKENLWRWCGRKRAGAKSRPLSRADLLRLASAETIGRSFERKIPGDPGRRIVEVWRTTLSAERQPPQERGLDGVELLLGCHVERIGARFWHVWSPRPGTPANDLMRLAAAVRRLVVDEERPEVEKVLAELEARPFRADAEKP